MAIYFIQAGTNGPIKIGQTNNGIKERIAQLQTGCPYELKLIWLYGGDTYTEHEIHGEFQHERIRGEWFRPTKDLICFIEENLYNRYEVVAPNYGHVVLYEHLTYTAIDAGCFSFNLKRSNYDVYVGIDGPFGGDAKVVVANSIGTVLRR